MKWIENKKKVLQFGVKCGIVILTNEVKCSIFGQNENPSLVWYTKEGHFFFIQEKIKESVKNFL